MKYRIAIMMALVGALAACQKPVDMDVAVGQSRAVVKSMNVVGEDVQVHLSLSVPTFMSYSNMSLNDLQAKAEHAEVALRVGGGAEIHGTANGRDYTFACTPQEGEEVSLRVKIPDVDEVTATAVVPQKPLVENIVCSQTSVANVYNLQGLELSFDLTDRAASDDYYSLRVLVLDTIVSTYYDTVPTIVDSIPIYDHVVAQDTEVGQYYHYFVCNDPLLMGGEIDYDDLFNYDDMARNSRYVGNEFLFRDLKFAGERHHVTIELGSGYDDYYYEQNREADIDYGAIHHVETHSRVALQVEVSAISFDMYMYKRTMEAARDWDDDFGAIFAEPVQIHTNINGGMGILGFYNMVKQKINLND